MTPTKVILDVDTGTDDAVAVMLAALHPEIELIACTTVFGNHEVARCTDNTLRVLDHIGRGDIPVHGGLAGPLLPVPVEADPMAEASGTPLHLAELPLPPALSTAQRAPAVEVLIETFRATTEPITLVATGCLTNVAAAVAAEPALVAAVADLRIMGGGHEVGNVTPSAEANIYRDPEAAAVVLGAGFRRLTLVLLDATHRALVTREHCERLTALGTPAALATAAFVEHRIVGHDATQPMALAGSAPVHDAVCVASIVEPDVITTRRLNVVVETAGHHTRGRTVVDAHHRSGRRPNASVAFDADAERFVDLLERTFAPI